MVNIGPLRGPAGMPQTECPGPGAERAKEVRPLKHHSTFVSSLLVPVKLLLAVLAHIFIVAEIREDLFQSEAHREQVRLDAAVPKTAASVVNSQFAYVP
jgi:hypothetical protein